MDVTAIYNSEGEQLFPTAVILRASIAPSNTFATHTVEDGSTVADNKIINQTRISMAIILNSDDYQEIYKNIQTASDDTTKLSIQTRVDTFDNMYIESYPSEESPDMFDTISLNVDFIEQIQARIEVAKLGSSDVSNQSDVDTTNRGEQLPQAAEIEQTTLQRWFS